MIKAVAIAEWNGVAYKDEKLQPADPSRERLQCNEQSTEKFTWHDKVSLRILLEDTLSHQENYDLQVCYVFFQTSKLCADIDQFT